MGKRECFGLVFCVPKGLPTVTCTSHTYVHTNLPPIKPPADVSEKICFPFAQGGLVILEAEAF